MPPPEEPEPVPSKQRDTSARGRRRTKAPWVWTHVVNAVDTSVLSPLAKLVWREHYVFEPKGCWASASAFARRLGVSRRTIERARQDLLRWGLLGRIDRGAGRTAVWYPELPARCRPQGRRVTDDDAERLAEVLADHIRTSVSGDGGSVPNDEQATTSDTPWRGFEHDEAS